MDSYIGQIMMVGFNFAPQNWIMCDGSLLAINQYQALYALLGTTFGGNGSTTFGVPDLRGRVAVSPGSGPGLQPVNWGQMGGEQTVTLTAAQMPPHTHSVTQPVSNNDADLNDPTNAVPAATTAAAYTNAGNASGPLAPAKCDVAGGGQAHDNMPPYTAVYFIMCVNGIFPSRP